MLARAVGTSVTAMICLGLAGCDVVFAIDRGDGPLAVDAVGADGVGGDGGVDAPGPDAQPVLLGAGAWMVDPTPLTTGLSVSNQGIRFLHPDGTVDAVFDSVGSMLHLTLRLGETRSVSRASDLTAFPPAAQFASSSSIRFSSDGNTAYFGAGATLGFLDVYRSDFTNGTWSAAEAMTAPTAADERWYSPCDGDRVVYALSPDAVVRELVEYSLSTEETRPLVELDGPNNDTGPRLMPNCLELYFESGRAGNSDIYYSQRTSIDAAWSTPVPVAGVSEDVRESDPWVSNDGQVMIFNSDKLDGTAGFQLRFARRMD